MKYDKEMAYMEQIRRKLLGRLCLVTVVCSLSALALADRRFAGSFSIGCGTMVLNFYSLFTILQNIFEGSNAKAGAYVGFLMLKFVVLGMGIYFLNRYFALHLTAFGLGFFIIAISATYVMASLQKNS